jgi:hypothetical protein
VIGGDGKSKTGLLAALLSLSEQSATAASVFTPRACREFLQVHESDGVEWFNRERFEEFSEWLALLAVLLPDKFTLTAGNLSTAAIQAERELTRSIGMAAHVGYRTGLYLQMSSSAEKSPATEKTVAAGRKKLQPEKRDEGVTALPAKRKPDVTSPARTSTTKTPHDKISG